MSDFMRSEAMEVAIELLKDERDKLREENDGLNARFHTYNKIMADHAIAFKDMESKLTKAREAFHHIDDCAVCKDARTADPWEIIDNIMGITREAFTELKGEKE